MFRQLMVSLLIDCHQRTSFASQHLLANLMVMQNCDGENRR
jgi:hypothetical protein